MESPVDLWQRRAAEDWIFGIPAAELRAAIARRSAASAAAAAGARMVRINAVDTREFVLALVAALASREPVHVFLGDAPALPTDSLPRDETRILIATGGTSGVPRWAVHSRETLHAAAVGLQAALGGGPIHSVCFLPLHHVSGLMQLVRSGVSGGTLTLLDARALGRGEFASVPANAVTSLVPTLLARMLDLPGGPAWLRTFQAVFLGGGPAWPELLQRARAEQVPLAPCYGMTETAAQVTLLSPADFLSGRSDAGVPLPHATIEIVDEVTGVLLPPRSPGPIRVKADSLFHGFLPDAGERRAILRTNDRGMLDADGHLAVLGRSDAVIITGGEKVDPAVVEAAARATGVVRDIVVTGVPDAEWGEAVVAIAVVPSGEDREHLPRRLRDVLPPPQRPKRWIFVEQLPRDGAGKLDRRILRDLAG